MPVLAQAPYHGAGQTGATVGASGLHTTKVDVTSLGVDVVGTVAPRVDLAATVAYVRPSASYLDGWSATGTGTVYPLAGPAAWLGLTAGLSHVRAAYADGMSVVLGASVAGRVEAGGVTLVPQASVAMLSELDGRTDAGGTVGLGLALGIVVPTRAAPLIIEPTVSVADDSGFRTSQGTLRYDLSYGASLRLLFSRGG